MIKDHCKIYFYGIEFKQNTCRNFKRSILWGRAYFRVIYSNVTNDLYNGRINTSFHNDLTPKEGSNSDLFGNINRFSYKQVFIGRV